MSPVDSDRIIWRNVTALGDSPQRWVTEVGRITAEVRSKPGVGHAYQIQIDGLEHERGSGYVNTIEATRAAERAITTADLYLTLRSRAESPCRACEPAKRGGSRTGADRPK